MESDGPCDSYNQTRLWPSLLAQVSDSELVDKACTCTIMDADMFSLWQMMCNSLLSFTVEDVKCRIIVVLSQTLCF